ncbi:PREDICTED: glutaminyl-peptide cyclotransferase-like [Amphimedon queenslandica]|uniref:Glutaminyl-peptide cyclotransferase n=1 Tax=Amphimedon queenslandica TaxID=400682 RepID=A0A1X7V9Y6_AMPQE|nr:PREDICTED: glutaminyl-peptide cyclotransferase-like [Amphimedon queenslandica]|eukprot:XP_003385059.1 PREDICTED: glutaminyl-peptide cyclotransferase-like [Amphimedon queenslandica]
MSNKLSFLSLLCLVAAVLSQRTTHHYVTLTSKKTKTISSCCDIENIKTYDFPNILKERVPDTPTHATVKEYILSRLHQLNQSRWSITTDVFTDQTPFGPKSFTNIIATLDPHVPKRLVLAAHYDSKYFKTGVFLGATDSALPVALILDILLTLDDKLQSRELQDHSLQVILFDGEEAFKTWTDTDSLYGSRHLAELMNSPSPYDVEGRTGIEAMEAFILLDLLGSVDPHALFYDTYPAGSKIFERLRKIEKKLHQEKQLVEHTRQHFVEQAAHGYYKIQDDHIPFLNKGVPIVHVIPVPFPSQWHKLSDNANAINWNNVLNLKKIFTLFLYEYFHLR